jgi:glycine cleavage system transcriptional repressor
MNQWFMLTLVGRDKKGIVAKVSSTIFEAGGNLGETSMIRLGGNFTVMMMIQSSQDLQQLQAVISPVAQQLSLRMHLDLIDATLHDYHEPNVDITVYGADKAGIVARVTSALADAGLHILDMQTVVAGDKNKPIYIMQIEGEASEGVDALKAAVDSIGDSDVEVKITAMNTLIG